MPRARDILAQACSLDLDKFETGRCARGTFARTRALIQVIQQHHVYDVFVESSYAGYLGQWLTPPESGSDPRNALSGPYPMSCLKPHPDPKTRRPAS